MAIQLLHSLIKLPEMSISRSQTHRILVTGASGQLGVYIVKELMGRGITPKIWSGKQKGQIHGLDLEPVALEDQAMVLSRLNELQPTVIIHAGAMSAADDVRKNPQIGMDINTLGTKTLADWASLHGARLVYTSTDLVFDGTKSMWIETDEPRPLLEYGRTKAAAEPYVISAEGGLVVRISLLYGPTLTGRPSFFTTTLDAVRQGQIRSLFTDEWRTPLDYQTGAEVLCDLAIDRPGCTGVIHLGGPERMSRYELLLRSARGLGLDSGLIQPGLAAEMELPEPRPRDVSLSTEKLCKILPERHLRTVEEVVSGM